MHAKPVSYVSMLNAEIYKKKENFRSVANSESVDGTDLAIPISSVEVSNNRFFNLLVGYFIRKRFVFPIVENYVKNTWAKFGIMKVMMNSNYFFFFKFSSKWFGTSD